MFQMRPGVKFKMWAPRFKNRPEVEPPGLLRLISALSIFSIIGLLLYAVARSTTGASLDADAVSAAYVATLHFVLPFGAFYTVSTNSPLSRFVVALYAITLCTATIAGKGLLGALPFDEYYKTGTAAVVLVSVLLWLFVSPRMRFYYSAISNKPVPLDLVGWEDELEARNRLSPKARAAVVWVLDHMETVVLLGFIVVVIVAFAKMA